MAKQRIALEQAEDNLAAIARQLEGISCGELSQAERNIYVQLHKIDYLDVDVDETVILGRVFENR